MADRGTGAATLLKDVGEKAVSALGEAAGKAFVDKLWDLAGRWFAENTESVPPTVSALAVRSYLEGRAFSPLARRQVTAWAIWELSQTSKNEAEIILRAASVRGDPASAVDAVVAYFARTRFGISTLATN